MRFDEAIFEREGYLAGSDLRRLEELRAAIIDPSVRAIVAARGGYGAQRLLDGLDPELVRSHPKILVGFSDITALHALWARAGVRSIHGAMVAALGRGDEALLERWRGLLYGAVSEPVGDLRAIVGGRAEGVLVGGNLAILAALCGTPYAPPLDGAILFLEDIGERPYRVDRMLTTLHHAGWLARVAGVALGAFTESPPGSDGVEVSEVLVERLGALQVPVVMGVPAGHIDDNLELPFGSRVALDADAGMLTFLEPAATG